MERPERFCGATSKREFGFHLFRRYPRRLFRERPCPARGAFRRGGRFRKIIGKNPAAGILRKIIFIFSIEIPTKLFAAGNHMKTIIIFFLFALAVLISNCAQKGRCLVTGAEGEVLIYDNVTRDSCDHLGAPPNSAVFKPN